MENLCGGGGGGLAGAEKQRLRRKAGAVAGSARLLPLALRTRCAADRNMLPQHPLLLATSAVAQCWVFSSAGRVGVAFLLYVPRPDPGCQLHLDKAACRPATATRGAGGRAHAQARRTGAPHRTARHGTFDGPGPGVGDWGRDKQVNNARASIHTIRSRQSLLSSVLVLGLV
jgi:hypothetical protein